MPKNVFSKNGGSVRKLKRNAFDLSKTTIFSTDIGVLRPVYCKEVIPGDSVQIDASLLLQSFPTVFPIQTRIRADVHYFYVRNRTLMDKFDDFIFNTKEGIIHPYIVRSSKDEDTVDMFKVGGLANSLGVPVTLSQKLDKIVSLSFTQSGFITNNGSFSFSRDDFYRSFFNDISGQLFPVSSSDFLFPTISSSSYPTAVAQIAFTERLSSSPLQGDFIFLSCDNTPISSFSLYGLAIYATTSTNSAICFLGNNYVTEFVDGRFSYKFDVSSYITIIDALFADIDNVDIKICLLRLPSDDETSSIVPNNSYFIPPVGLLPSGFSGITDLDQIISIPENSSIVGDDVPFSDVPYFGDIPSIPISALPFRGYEMICNYFYRNDLNNPYILNGEVEYNEFIPTHSDGPDDNYYGFHRRNWELDRFTSAVQSPQFGAAPLVGLTHNQDGRTAVMEFRSEGVMVDGVPTSSRTYRVTVGLDQDGVIDGIVDYDKDTPSGNLRSLLDLSTVGISINDLRNVNSFQRFLENTIRRGMRYRNQLLSHFGTSVDYPDIDVPQFIGGFSGYLGKSRNVSTGSSDSLGDFNGELHGSIQAKHKIRCYCPEHGFIIGIMSLSPTPIYSQVLDPMFMRQSYLDYYQSEFGKIGYVPIFDKEISPLQTDDVNHIFGYQRAWYDYMSDFDTVQGDFLTTLKDWVLTRYYSNSPSLTADFTQIEKDQLNDVWATTHMVDKYGSGDKFMCSIYHDVKFIRPIPRHGVPSLE